jgi:hypothetical protein
MLRGVKGAVKLFRGQLDTLAYVICKSSLHNLMQYLNFHVEILDYIKTSTGLISSSQKKYSHQLFFD